MKGGETSLKHLKCYSCGETFNVDSNLMVCEVCASPLTMEYNLEDLSSRFEVGGLRSRVRSVWRYEEFLPPFEKEDLISLGEGFTPVIESRTIRRELGLEGLFFKLEFVNPTGSLKDRGSTVLISRVKNLGVRCIADDSSGNAGASIAAYSSKVGIDCRIFVPEKTPTEKIIQAVIYGAEIVRVPGGRTETFREIMRQATEGKFFYASHNLSPYFLEGNKTFALEIIEQTEGSLPEHIIFPTGGGSLFLGSYKGFVEAKGIGWIEEIPKLHVVQPEACAPIVKAFEKREREVKPVEEGESIAGGLKIADPPRGGLILKGLYETGGSAVSVSDGEIIDSYLHLAGREGIFCEPTSATALAALRKFIDKGEISSSERVLLPITGFGLKDTKNAVRIAVDKKLIPSIDGCCGASKSI